MDNIVLEVSLVNFPVVPSQPPFSFSQAIDELSDLVHAAQQTDLILGAQGVAAFTNCWKS